MPKRTEAAAPDLLVTGARPRLTPETAAALKHYVYVYVDPRTDTPFPNRAVGRCLFVEAAPWSGQAHHRRARF